MKSSLSVISLLLIVICISRQGSAQFGPPPVATKEVAGIEPDDVVVECYQRGVKVIIEKARFPRIRSSEKLHFLDPACIAGENETHFIASTSYRACGVSRKAEWNGLVYSNTLMTGFPDTDDFDIRCPVVSIKFKCVHSFFAWPRPRMTRAVAKYINCEHIVMLGPKIKNGILGLMRARSSGIRMRSRVLSCPLLIGVGPPIQNGQFGRVTVRSKGIKVKRKKALVCRPLKQQGEFDMELKAYSDDNFSKEIGRIFETPELTVDIFYELKLNANDSFLTVYPKRCYATPTANRHDQIQFVFIKDGCVKDDTIQIYSAPRNSYRFSIKSFKFVGIKDAMLFVHCDVSICDAEDVESPCARGCSSRGLRRRRSGARTITDGFSKNCKFQSMEITLDRSVIQDTTAQNVHLDNPNCIAGTNETHFFFVIKKGHCGTLTKIRRSLVEISNNVHFPVARGQKVNIPVQCKYTENAASSSAAQAFKIASRERFVSVGLGQYHHFVKKVVIDPAVKWYTLTAPLRVKTTETKEFLHVNVDSVVSNDDVFFTVDHCKIKPSPSSRRKVTVVEHGCGIDDGAAITESERSTLMTFALQRWKDLGKRLFIRCHFTVCHKNSALAQCQKRTCSTPKTEPLQKRRRRSVRRGGIESSVTCRPGKITIAIKKESAPNIKATEVHLRDRKCGARENRTHFILETKPYECGTSLKSFGRFLMYSNVAQNDETIIGGIIRRPPTLKLPFKCIFIQSKRYGATFKTRKNNINFSGISSGTYSVRIRLYTDPSYDIEMDSFNAMLSPGSDMYFQVAVEAPNASLAIYLESCYGQPFFSIGSTDRYEFIKNNCPLDDSVLFYRTERSDQKRFSVAPFEFSSSSPYKSVYVNCIISTCNPNESKSRCNKTCPNTPLPI